jgi:hypothetical protein
MQLLDRFFAAKDSLSPIDLLDAETKDARLHPRYKVAFHLEGPSEASGDLRLEIGFKDNGYGHYDKDYCRWFRLTNDELDTAKVMEINLIDLENRLVLNLLIVPDDY